jgi:hypothetical protein
MYNSKGFYYIFGWIDEKITYLFAVNNFVILA